MVFASERLRIRARPNPESNQDGVENVLSSLELELTMLESDEEPLMLSNGSEDDVFLHHAGEDSDVDVCRLQVARHQRFLKLTFHWKFLRCETCLQRSEMRSGGWMVVMSNASS